MPCAMTSMTYCDDWGLRASNDPAPHNTFGHVARQPESVTFRQISYFTNWCIQRKHSCHLYMIKLPIHLSTCNCLLKCQLSVVNVILNIVTKNRFPHIYVIMGITSSMLPYLSLHSSWIPIQVIVNTDANVRARLVQSCTVKCMLMATYTDTLLWHYALSHNHSPSWSPGILQFLYTQSCSLGCIVSQRVNLTSWQ